MKGVKRMLLGIALLFLTLLVHLLSREIFYTDFLAVIGLLLVLIGFWTKDGSDTANH